MATVVTWSDGGISVHLNPQDSEQFVQKFAKDYGIPIRLYEIMVDEKSKALIETDKSHNGLGIRRIEPQIIKGNILSINKVN